MEIQHLTYFYWVAKKGSVTEAARHLRISAPAVSKMINNLETSFKKELFTRSHRKLYLTSFGEKLLSQVVPLMEQYDLIRVSAFSEQKEISGEIRVGVSDNIAHYLFPKWLKEFNKAYPKVVVSLFTGTSTDIIEKIKSANADLGVFYTPTQDQSLRLTLWQEVKFYFVCSPDFALFDKKNITPEVLSQYPFIGARTRDYIKKSLMEKVLKDLKVSSPIVFSSNSQELQKRLVLEGLGYALVPYHLVSEEVKQGLIWLIKIQKDISFPIYFAQRRGEVLSEPVRRFRDFMKSKKA